MFAQNLTKKHLNIFAFAIRFFDVLLVIGSAWLSYYLFFGTFALSLPYQRCFFIAALVSFLSFSQFDLYHFGRGKRFLSLIYPVFWACVTLFVGLATLAFLLKVSDFYSRKWFAVWSLLSLFSLVVFRRIFILCLRIMRARGWNRKNIVICGLGELGQEVGRKILGNDWLGFNISAFFDDKKPSQEKPFKNIPLHSFSQLTSDFIKGQQISEVWLALPLSAQNKIDEIIQSLRHETILIRFIPDVFMFKFLLNQSVSDVAGIITLNVNESPITGVNRLIKAIEDRVVAFLFLVIFSPLLLLIGLLVKLTSKGPMLFKQVRHGWDGRPINVYKFRTMEVALEEGFITQAKKNDPRVTAFGRFLRKTSLDELPQFWNVLQGRMSVVGPRPHAISHNEYYKDQVEHYFQRHKVKPGITGWAQVNGWRGETDTLDKMKKRVEYDLYYIKNWSLWLDLKIIILTVFKGFINPKAY